MRPRRKLPTVGLHEVKPLACRRIGGEVELADGSFDLLGGSDICAMPPQQSAEEPNQHFQAATFGLLRLKLLDFVAQQRCVLLHGSNPRA